MYNRHIFTITVTLPMYTVLYFQISTTAWVSPVNTEAHVWMVWMTSRATVQSGTMANFVKTVNHFHVDSLDIEAALNWKNVLVSLYFCSFLVVNIFEQIA